MKLSDCGLQADLSSVYRVYKIVISKKTNDGSPALVTNLRVPEL